MPSHSSLQQIRQREASGLAYQLLATLYYPPDGSFGATVDALAELWAEWQPDLLPHLSVMQASAHTELLVDYTRLFLGPFKVLASPYGSVYLEGKRELMGESTQEVHRIYQRAGLELTQESKEVPDHIAIELEFLYYLICQETNSLAQDNLPLARQWADTQAAFLTRHLGVWGPALAERISQHATTDFYRSLAHITAAFLEREKLHFSTDPARNSSVESQEMVYG